MEKGLSVRESAQRSGICHWTMRAWLRQGRLPYYRLGRRVVIDEKDLLEFLGAHRVSVAQDVVRRPHVVVSA
jgi:excisionase family DNA binding protein